MTGRYVLIGQTPVLEPDLLTWAKEYEENRIVQQTQMLGCMVSTIFLGLDHQWGKGPPLLFETRVFWPDEGGYEQERCSTWMEAQHQHAAMCVKVARPGAVVAYIGRCLTNAWDQAKRDLGDRWRELRGGELTDIEKGSPFSG